MLTSWNHPAELPALLTLFRSHVSTKRMIYGREHLLLLQMLHGVLQLLWRHSWCFSRAMGHVQTCTVREAMRTSACMVMALARWRVRRWGSFHQPCIIQGRLGHRRRGTAIALSRARVGSTSTVFRSIQCETRVCFTARGDRRRFKPSVAIAGSHWTVTTAVVCGILGNLLLLVEGLERLLQWLEWAIRSLNFKHCLLSFTGEWWTTSRCWRDG